MSPQPYFAPRPSRLCSPVRGLIGALLLTLFAAALPAQNEAFEKAHALYQVGKYETARTQFEALAQQQETPALRHNLALTHLKLQQPAAARWQIERARLLAPLNNQYRQTQQHILKQLQLADTSYPALSSAAQILPDAGWLWLATLSGWLLLAALLLPRFSDRKPSLGIKASRIICGLLLLAALPALYFNHQQLQTGIVTTAATAPLRSAPASAAPENGIAQSGERARIIGQHNQFYQVKTPQGLTGWLPATDFRPLAQ
jgi:hypothetical protein